MLSMSMSYLMDQSPNCPFWRLQFPRLFTKTHIFLCLVIDPTLPSKNMESRKNSEDSHLWNAMFHIHVAWWKVPIVFSQLLQFFIRPLASPELPLWLQLVNTHPINPGRSVCLKVLDIRFINQSLQICIYIYIHISSMAIICFTFQDLIMLNVPPIYGQQILMFQTMGKSFWFPILRQLQIAYVLARPSHNNLHIKRRWIHEQIQHIQRSDQPRFLCCEDKRGMRLPEPVIKHGKLENPAFTVHVPMN